ncbi:hypothetical protein GCM10023258_39580 [Terrabacter aeriphilus]|uniref:Uncharacterized protein n=1 Tax=Terrabacter aeriphilus TaxID=515662 RepID=A0ABP9JN10_9MICO
MSGATRSGALTTLLTVWRETEAARATSLIVARLLAAELDVTLDAVLSEWNVLITDLNVHIPHRILSPHGRGVKRGAVVSYDSPTAAHARGGAR